MFIQSRDGVYAGSPYGSLPLAYKRVTSCLRLQCGPSQSRAARLHPPGRPAAWVYFGVKARRPQGLLVTRYEQNTLFE